MVPAFLELFFLMVHLHAMTEAVIYWRQQTKAKLRR
jgi:hypothetical protein